MDLKKLHNLLKKEPAFRIRQVEKAIFKDFIGDWNEATTLPLNLREKLNLEFPLAINADVNISKKNESAKALITLDDGCKIETVLMKHKNKRNTVCVSSQVGCPLGCKFCATGQMGFERNLTADEIITQVLLVSRILKKEDRHLTNVVFMGMGEPFLNYEEVMKAVTVLNDPNFFGIAARHISISTIGVMEIMKKFADSEFQYNLAVSLHAANDDLRAKLIPYHIHGSLKRLMAMCDYYMEKTGRRLMFEYIMIKDQNDSEAHAKELSELLKKLENKLYFVNLIVYNQTGAYQPSTTEKVDRFKKILDNHHISSIQRFKFGEDIEAACGQLAKKAKKC